MNGLFIAAMMLLQFPSAGAAGRELDLDLAISSTPYIETLADLPVEHQRQGTSLWCWAASSAMVVSYHQRARITDCELLSEAISKNEKRPVDCCKSVPYCNRPGFESDVVKLMELKGVKHRWSEGQMSYAELSANIDANRPLIVIQHGGAAGHVMVVSGYLDGGRIVILDPMKRERTVAAYRDFAANPRLRWVKSLVTSAD